jgi:elongator complex protein 6
LDTGFAKDVSGVLRITENQIGLDLALQPDNDASSEEKCGRELLYLVKGDGSVKMFERGAGGDI